MTDFHIEVIKIGELQNHPDADRLSITKVNGYQVITAKDQFKTGDLAVYIPVDSVVPINDPKFAFLKGHARIKAIRLRGIFSMGLLIPAEPGMEEGQEVADQLGIKKYLSKEELKEIEQGSGGANEKDPGWMPVYDIENLRRWPKVLEEGEEVWISEKIHGENFRVVHDGTRLWVASRTKYKRDIPGSHWWELARQHNLEEKLSKVPYFAFYGESHGYTGGYPYGVPTGKIGFRVFDILDVKTRNWLNIDDQRKICAELGLDVVPELYRGPYSYDKCIELTQGNSTLADHIREGCVIRPVQERFHQKLGRVILKVHSEAWLLKHS